MGLRAGIRVFDEEASGEGCHGECVVRELGRCEHVAAREAALGYFDMAYVLERARGG